MITKLSTIIFFMFFLSLISCSNRNKKTSHFSKQDSLLVDSLTKIYKENVSYSFGDASPVYVDSKSNTISDTLPMTSRLFIDSVFYIKKDSNQVTMYAVQFVKKGKVGKGFMADQDVAKKSLVSKKDPGIIFIGNYLPVKDQVSICLRSVRNGKVENEISLDTSYMSGFELEMELLDSVSLTNTTELIYVNTYYPACGYLSTHYYLDYSNAKFNIVFSEFSWADAPYYNNPSIYLPTPLNSKDLLYQMWGNNIQRDTSNQPMVFKIPENIKIPNNQLIYIERWENTDSMVGGKTLWDKEYDEPMLFDICSEKKLYKWDGTKLELIKM